MNSELMSCLVLFFICVKTNAQSYIVKGSVIQKDKKPVENVIITSYKDTSNTILKSALTDSLGNFMIELKNPNVVVIRATYSNKLLFSQIIQIKRELTDIGRIEVDMVKAQEAVTVLAQQSFITRKADRVVINPDAMFGNAGGTALDVIEKSPGVQVDIINGTISMKGRPGVLIMIDDKPTPLGGNDLANYLKSLPASLVASVEIMQTPPANFDASCNAGIINIKLKRLKITGYNGSVSTTYGQGSYHINNNSAVFNYRKNKINFMSSAAYNNNSTFQDLTINRFYNKPNGSLNTSFTQNTYIPKNLQSGNIKLGLDYYVTAKTVLGFSFFALQNKDKIKTSNSAFITDSAYNVTNTVSAFNPSDKTLKNLNFNFNINHKLNKKGSEISANADHLTYNIRTDQYLLNTVKDNLGAITSYTKLVSNLPSELKISAFKFDNSTHIKNGKFETGLKSSFVNTNNKANFFDEVNTQLNPNYTFSNKYKYDENVNAAYVNFSTAIKKKTQFQTGLRMEQTNVNGLQYDNPTQRDSVFKRTYANLFPTVFLMQPLDSAGKHVATFSYGKRINRPNYQDMNPFTNPMDRFTLYGGNPFLNPTFSHNFELAHTYKNKITTTVEFSHTLDIIRETNQQVNGIFYSRPGNIGTFNSFSLSNSSTFSLHKKLTLIMYGELTRVAYKDVIYGETLNNVGTYAFLNPTFQYVLNKKWSFELAATYQSSVVVGQFVTIPVWHSRIGFSTKCLKDKGAIRFNLNDMFYTNQPGGRILAIANSNANWKSYLDTRVAVIAFTYRFNKGKNLGARQNTTAADTEKSRI